MNEQPPKGTSINLTKLPALSVFFPAHNEATNIPQLLDNAAKILPRFATEYEIIVVDDGSTDGTKEILDEYKNKIPQLRIVQHEKNRGYGAAVRSGLSACQYEYVFFSDSDNQFDLSEIALLLPHIRQFDAVFGFRGKRKDPFMRTLNAFGWKIVNRLLLGITARDLNCAFKLMRRAHFSKLDLKSDGAMISAELLAYFNLKKLRIKEVEVSHFPRKSGEQSGANLNVIKKAFKELFIIRKAISNFSKDRS